MINTGFPPTIEGMGLCPLQTHSLASLGRQRLENSLMTSVKSDQVVAI